MGTELFIFIPHLCGGEPLVDSEHVDIANIANIKSTVNGEDIVNIVDNVDNEPVENIA